MHNNPNNSLYSTNVDIENRDSPVELGLVSFGETGPHEIQSYSLDSPLLGIIDDIVLADNLGIPYFGLGEHHRSDFAITCPEIIIAAAGLKTRQIKLGPAVSIIGADHPLRVFERLQQLGMLIGDRLEPIFGRGSFLEPYHLYDIPMAAYPTALSHNMHILLECYHRGRFTNNDGATFSVGIKPVEKVPQMWVAAGSRPETIKLAASLGLNMMLASATGSIDRLRSHVDYYLKLKKPPMLSKGKVGLNAFGHVAKTDTEALERLWEYDNSFSNSLRVERNQATISFEDFKNEAYNGSTFIGSPDTVARKIGRAISTLGLSRFLLKYSAANMPDYVRSDCITLFSNEVIPRIAELDRKP